MSMQSVMDEYSKFKLNKQVLNNIVLNYLIFEGYEETALKFAKEIDITVDSESINDKLLIGLNSINFRNKIKLNILKGEINIAINELNLKYPDLLEEDEYLYFKLLLLNLIEMIRSRNKDGKTKGGDVDDDEFILSIIKFAQDKLTNKAIKSKKFMEELELAMTLLLYNNTGAKDAKDLPPKLKQLFEISLRRDIANLVNKSILVKEMNNLLDLNYKNHINHQKSASKGNMSNTINQINQEINTVDHDSINDNDTLSNETFDEGGRSYEEDDDGENDELHDNVLIDSNFKKLIKLWIWLEQKISLNYDGDVSMFELKG